MNRSNEMPAEVFHPGELAVQQQAGVRAEAARLSSMLRPPDLRGGAAGFLAERTLAAITARDDFGRLWISPLTGPPGVLDVIAASTLRVRTAPAAADPLHSLPPGQPVGLLAIDFATRRRLRVNGTLTTADEDGLTLQVDQAYGNCPQYIQRRHLQPGPAVAGDGDGAPVRYATSLASDQARLIRAADTFFLGTTHPERGNDASHRGGPPGFVRVEDDSLWWPDYPGNNMFNSLGNLAVDSAAALVFADFATGHAVHLSGTAVLEWSPDGSDDDEGGTGRRVRFHISSVVDGSGAPRHAPHPVRRPPHRKD
ncbi:pyridoxamine 5'-phosphate oxidase family protein [Streptomyces spororaveus]|uniref:pyridoxamine 5'-phosphate oxidase family protein n=1 Tax=Streptomyces spororaveus TaxID=284039 RepID=UPI002079EE3C|nr:pyridoxamine 5'-phosphate oxidase family protein [Streptomyces spororaveus]MCM9083046.1 pyridoxamine 5'-phosphate oxidase family protein [Streptomyces spororaveus]